VIGRIRSFFTDPSAILDAVRDEHTDGAGQKRLIGRGHRIAEKLPTLAPDKTRAILMALLGRVDIRSDRIDIKICRRNLIELLHGQPIDAGAPAGKPGSASGETLMLTVKARLQRVGREMKMLVENADEKTSADPGLLRIVARAHDFQERLMQDPNLTVPAIANHECLSIGYLSRLLRLPTVAPDIVTAIINGKNPPQLTAKKLMRLAAHLPVDWAEQRKRLGFQER